ncbi:MAG: beta-galactosidase [Methanosarcinales archaeon]
MRPVLMAKIESFNIESVKPRIDEIVNNFNNYLEAYWTVAKRKGISKHALMGPVSKALQMIRVQPSPDIEAVKGYILRVHEMSTYANVDPSDLKALDNGIEQTINLIEDVQRVNRPSILDRIDYRVYYKRKHKQMEYFENVRKAWIEMLRRKYKKIEELNDAWKMEDKEKIEDFDKITLKYTPTSKTKVDKWKESMKKDGEDFLKQKPELMEFIEEEEEGGE